MHARCVNSAVNEDDRGLVTSLGHRLSYPSTGCGAAKSTISAQKHGEHQRDLDPADEQDIDTGVPPLSCWGVGGKRPWGLVGAATSEFPAW